MQLAERAPIAATDNERPVLRAVDRVMQEDEAPSLKLVASTGKEFVLPPCALSLLHQVVHALAKGQIVSLVPLHKELTTQEAADLLSISRPHLITLLDKGDLPHTKLANNKPSSHRRIRFSDLMEYKARRDEERVAALDSLARLDMELGLFDVTADDPALASRQEAKTNGRAISKRRSRSSKKK